MLGSVIPKRWVMSLALVGLVSLFAASYAAVWTDPASAAGPSATIPDPEVLEDVEVGSSLTVNTTQAVQIAAHPIGGTGQVNDDMDGLIWTWSITTGPGALTNADERIVTYTPSSTGTASLEVSVIQPGKNGPFTDTMTITIVTPPAPGTPSPAPVNPGPVPTIPNPPSGQTLEVVTPAEGASLSTSDGITVNVPVGAVTNFFGVKTKPVAAGAAPEPGSFKLGSKVVDIVFTDTSGAEFDNFRTGKPVQICMPVTQADIDAAFQGPAGIKIYRYANPPGQYIQLSTTFTPGVGSTPAKVCANASNFSVFAVGLLEGAAAPGGDVLPATGDYTPNAAMLTLASLLGLGLVGVGLVTVRRSRKGNSAA